MVEKYTMFFEGDDEARGLFNTFEEAQHEAATDIRQDDYKYYEDLTDDEVVYSSGGSVRVISIFIEEEK